MQEHIDETAALDTTANSGERRREMNATGGSDAGARARILIVEDELIFAEDMKQRLTKMGHEVVAIVTSGESAVERAAELEPDLVLMDISLRGALTGVDAALAIQAAIGAAIVYVTGHGDPDTLLRARTTDGFSFILKPIDDNELRYLIEMGMHRRRLKQNRS